MSSINMLSFHGGVHWDESIYPVVLVFLYVLLSYNYISLLKFFLEHFYWLFLFSLYCPCGFLSHEYWTLCPWYNYFCTLHLHYLSSVLPSPSPVFIPSWTLLSLYLSLYSLEIHSSFISRLLSDRVPLAVTNHSSLSELLRHKGLHGFEVLGTQVHPTQQPHHLYGPGGPAPCPDPRSCVMRGHNLLFTCSCWACNSHVATSSSCM